MTTHRTRPSTAFLAEISAGAGITTAAWTETPRSTRRSRTGGSSCDGAEAVAAQLSGWYDVPTTIESAVRRPIPGGEAVELDLSWVEGGVPHAAHQVHLHHRGRRPDQPRHCVLRRPLAGRAAGRDGGRSWQLTSPSAPTSPPWTPDPRGARRRRHRPGRGPHLRRAGREPGSSGCVIDGEQHFLKSLSAADDWIMRVTGNTSNWEFKVWQAGLYAETPPVIDHTVRGMALEGDRLSILMTDCGDDLVPPGDDPVPAEHHADFIDAMAAMHAHFLWSGSDDASACRTCPVAGSSSRPRRSRPSSRWPTCRARSRSPTRAGGCSPSGRLASTPGP